MSERERILYALECVIAEANQLLAEAEHPS